MADLPDYYTQAQISEAEAASFKGGLAANRSPTPVSRDVYLGTDNHILYVCITDGVWTGFDAAILTQGILKLYANMNANSKKITNLAAPTLANDAARKADIDAIEPYTDEEAVAAVEAAGLILAAAKKIVFADDGMIQLGTSEDTPNIWGVRGAATAAVFMQPRSGNREGVLQVFPSGTETKSTLAVCNTSDLSNYGYFEVAISGLDVLMVPGLVGAGPIPTKLRIGFTLEPSTDRSRDLGKADKRWGEAYILHYNITQALAAGPRWSGITAPMTAGTALTRPQAVYVGGDGKMEKALATAAATMPAIALATGTIAENASGSFLLQGFFRYDTWDWTPGGLLYVSKDTAGALTQTLPAASGEQVQVVGVAITADIIHFNPSYELVEIS